MKITLSAIKADVGSIGGHIQPSQKLVQRVKDFVANSASGFIHDHYIGWTGDDICILISHSEGINSEKVHKLAWEAFKAGTELAEEQGLYGAGQDLLKDAFSGNIKGLGPAVAEIDFEERENEPFILFAADKTDPGAYSLPLYLAFADPMHCAGLILAPSMKKGFKFSIVDVEYTECNKCKEFHLRHKSCQEAKGNPKGDRIIKLKAPEELYDIAALLRDNERFVIEAIYSREDGEQAVAVSTTRLHNIAGKYTGKDDPICLVRVQGGFPATGEVLSPFSIGHFVAGFMRGSHTGPLMPVKLQTPISFFDGPPIVSGAAFSVHDGKFTEPADVFNHPYWDEIRSRISRKAEEIRRQGFSGAAMLPYGELEYGGITEKMAELDSKFKVRQ